MKKNSLGKLQIQNFDWESKRILDRSIKLLETLAKHNIYRDQEPKATREFIDKLSNMIG